MLKAFLNNDTLSPENYGLLGLQLEEDQYWRGGGRQSVGSWAVIGVAASKVRAQLYARQARALPR